MSPRISYEDPIDCIFYPSLPDGATAVMIVNRDGSIAVCSIQPENEWHAWSKWTSGTPDENDGLQDGHPRHVEPYARELSGR